VGNKVELLLRNERKEETRGDEEKESIYSFPSSSSLSSRLS